MHHYNVGSLLPATLSGGNQNELGQTSNALGFYPHLPGQPWLLDGTTKTVPQTLPDGSYNPAYLYNPSWAQVNEKPLLVAGAVVVAAVILYSFLEG